MKAQVSASAITASVKSLFLFEEMCRECSGRGIRYTGVEFPLTYYSDLEQVTLSIVNI